MPAFVPVVFSEDGTYILPVNIQKKGSLFVDIEFIPSRVLAQFIEEAKLTGQVVEPLIQHGFH